jgi:hypothetical protein
MKFAYLIFFILLTCSLVANPIMPGPILVEINRSGDDWQITLYNLQMNEFTLDNCGLSTNSGFSEFNNGIDFYETVTVNCEDLQDSLYLDWESDYITTFFDDGYGMWEVDIWSFIPSGNWNNSINPLFDGQSLRRHEPLMDYEFLVKDSNIEGGLRTKGYLEGYVYDKYGNPMEDASVKYYRTNSWLTGIFPPASTEENGFFCSETFAKNYDVSVTMNNLVLIDTFLTVEPDSIISVDFYTSYDPVLSDDHEIELPVSFYNLSNHPNPFNPNTEISFQISDFNDQNLEIQIFNTKGQRINVIFPSLCHPELVEGRGKISVEWNGKNHSGKSCPSGVYFYKLISGDKELAANKMLLLK